MADIRSRIPPNLLEHTARWLQNKTLKESVQSPELPANLENAIAIGAEACDTLLRTRIPGDRAQRLQQCPFSMDRPTSDSRDRAEQTTLPDPVLQCPFSSEAGAQMRFIGDETTKQEPIKPKCVPIFPDIEDGAGHGVARTTDNRRICALCPFANAKKGELLKKAPGCPLMFDVNGHVLRSKQEITGDRKKSDASELGSISNSIPQCPIRALDHHSPEEVAKYFEEHKREIPRSHEVCIKRYQNNTESIRKLDAKYGNLVNMIQGLSAKHQPFLASKDDEEHNEDAVSENIVSVKEWASNVKLQDTKDAKYVEASDHRQSHFDRPLKEIRVGESPSRPWGIALPVADGSDTDGPFASTGPKHGEAYQLGTARNGQSTKNAEKLQTPASTPHQGRQEVVPKVVFNGPVFIGYPPEQATAWIRQLGLSQSPVS